MLSRVAKGSAAASRLRATALWVAILPALLGCWGPPWWDEEKIVALYAAWRVELIEGRAAQAYARMSPGYRAAHSLNEFERAFPSADFWYPQLPSKYRLTGGRLFAELYPYGDAWWRLRNGVAFKFEKVGGEWFLTGERVFYKD